MIKDKRELETLLEQVAAGKTSVEQASLQLREVPYDDLGFAKTDLHRGMRQGIAEVIYGAGKTPEQILKIAQNLYSHYSKKYECWIYREEQLPEEYREKAEGMRRIADEMSLASFSIKTDPNPIRKPYRKRNQNNNDDNGDTAHTDTD